MSRAPQVQPPQLYACLLAKEFPAQAVLRLRPEMRDRACVIMQGEPPVQQVCSLNRRARSAGVARGMTQVEVETFPAVAVLPRSQDEEAAAKAILLECAGGFSPRVEECGQARNELGAFLCVIDIAGTERLHGPPPPLARSLLARVAALGITASVAVSCNFHAAIALAKGLSPQTSVRVVPCGDEAAALAPLPVRVLSMTAEHTETFASWGVRTLGMLAALPEEELIARMGQEGKRLRQLARGELPHLFRPVEPAFSLKERMELDSPVELLHALLFIVNLMLEQLVLRATARALALASLRMALSLEGGATHARIIRPALPSNDRQLWIKLLHLDLEAHPPPAPVLAVALEAEPGSAGKVQLGLFSPQLPEAARLEVTLARIRAIVGEENVGRALLTDTHRPDAFRMESFHIPTTQPAQTASAPSRSATRMLRPPDAVLVTLYGQRPATFIFREHRYVVEQAYGPWLTSGEWWNPTPWGWEQWDLAARTPEGSALYCCVVRDRMKGRWQMVALYD